jgi:hypothetical protein
VYGIGTTYDPPPLSACLAEKIFYDKIFNVLKNAGFRRGRTVRFRMVSKQILVYSHHQPGNISSKTNVHILSW